MHKRTEAEGDRGKLGATGAERDMDRLGKITWKSL